MLRLGLRRPFSSQALKEWISEPKKATIQRTLALDRVHELYTTLPTRADAPLPQLDDALGYGHHLVFFHPLHRENTLRGDGTELDFSPPGKTRRMWVGGEMVWNNQHPLRIGDSVQLISEVTADFVQVKKDTMVFVTQNMNYYVVGREEPAVKETRTHVYVDDQPNVIRPPKAGMYIDFSVLLYGLTSSSRRYPQG